jgi:hypothetical protein
MSKLHLEWAPFKLRAGVGEAALIQASDALQRDFLERQPGFVGRQLMRAPDGAYVDLVWWSSNESASAAMAKAAESAACAAYFEQMDADHAQAGAGVALYTSVKSYD